jgi:hypothetical protein
MTEASAMEVQREFELTMAGHWHPGGDDACDTRCPMGDPRSRWAFRKVLDRAAVSGNRPRINGYGDR